jgi:hypothetical protein
MELTALRKKVRLLLGLILLNAEYIPKLRLHKILRHKHVSLFVVLFICFHKDIYSRRWFS